MRYVVCFSGGHSSSLAAIETVKRYGKKNVILLNHDISPKVEHADIKRFKQDVADYLDLPITYANMPGWEEKTPLQICREIKAFKVGNGTELCTNRLKTEPFKKWLNDNFSVKPGEIRPDMTAVYGFDKNERDRIQRRVGIMADMGYRTDYPLACWERTIDKTENVGINRPVTYEIFKHANCIGCLKSRKLQWYLVYCLHPEIFTEAKEAEEEIGYSIINGIYMEDLEPQYRRMKHAGIVPSEKIPYQRFWADVRKIIPETDDRMPCECAI